MMAVMNQYLAANLTYQGDPMITPYLIQTDQSTGITPQNIENSITLLTYDTVQQTRYESMARNTSNPMTAGHDVAGYGHGQSGYGQMHSVHSRQVQSNDSQHQPEIMSSVWTRSCALFEHQVVFIFNLIFHRVHDHEGFSYRVYALFLFLLNLLYSQWPRRLLHNFRFSPFSFLPPFRCTIDIRFRAVWCHFIYNHNTTVSGSLSCLTTFKSLSLFNSLYL